MAKVELIMPKMGESIIEATILNWVKKPGDEVDEDETILEIATDKVDSEIPSPVKGKISEILYKENDVVEIGKVIAIIQTEGEDTEAKPTPSVAEKPKKSENGVPKDVEVPLSEPKKKEAPVQPVPLMVSSADIHVPRTGPSGKFYSPLVRNIAGQENISLQELENISGTGVKGRVTKNDILGYIQSRAAGGQQIPQKSQAPADISISKAATPAVSYSSDGGVEIIQMDRMRKLIAEHMVRSKHTSPHVTSFVEADVTNIFNWRNKHKNAFQEKYGQKITFTPIFIEAITKAIKDFPMVNISLDGENILVKKDINIGMAAALPSGNLIVPVITNADRLNLVGLTIQVNDLANRARLGKLKPEEIQGGTFTLTNVGTFGNVMGTPIINQPQVAIMATGAIRKKPAVLETEHGDVIAIRHMMFLSLSYDHRIVDGFLGGSFLRRVGDYLENFDTQQNI